MAELSILLRDFTNSEIVELIEKFTKAESERSVLRGKFIGLLRMDDLQMLYGEYGRVGTEKINKLCKSFCLWIEKGIEDNFKLGSCPFCGGEAVLEPYKARKGYEATIQCNGGCLLYMNTITYDTQEEAVEAVVKCWNTRTPKERGGEK